MPAMTLMPHFQIGDRVQVTEPGPDQGLVGVVINVDVGNVCHYVVDINRGVYIRRYAESRLVKAPEIAVSDSVITPL